MSCEGDTATACRCGAMRGKYSPPWRAASVSLHASVIATPDFHDMFDDMHSTLIRMTRSFVAFECKVGNNGPWPMFEPGSQHCA